MPAAVVLAQNFEKAVEILVGQQRRSKSGGGKLAAAAAAMANSARISQLAKGGLSGAGARTHEAVCVCARLLMCVFLHVNVRIFMCVFLLANVFVCVCVYLGTAAASAIANPVCIAQCVHGAVCAWGSVCMRQCVHCAVCAQIGFDGQQWAALQHMER